MLALLLGDNVVHVFGHLLAPLRLPVAPGEGLVLPPVVEVVAEGGGLGEDLEDEVVRGAHHPVGRIPSAAVVGALGAACTRKVAHGRAH